MNIKDQSHSLTLSKVTQIQHFQTSFPQKTLGRLKPNFILSLDIGIKICSNVLGHVAKMASMPIYGKNLLWNQEADDLETWYAASGSQVLPNLFK